MIATNGRRMTDATLKRLAGLRPKTLATMHGAVYVGDGSHALLHLAEMFHDVLGRHIEPPSIGPH